jgi:hypothetical protein
VFIVRVLELGIEAELNTRLMPLSARDALTSDRGLG